MLTCSIFKVQRRTVIAAYKDITVGGGYNVFDKYSRGYVLLQFQNLRVDNAVRQQFAGGAKMRYNSNVVCRLGGAVDLGGSSFGIDNHQRFGAKLALVMAHNRDKGQRAVGQQGDAAVAGSCVAISAYD